VVTTPYGSSTTSVKLADASPSLSVLSDGKHVAGIILRDDGSGQYGGGTYDILGPTGGSLGYSTVPAKPGDSVIIFGVGFGPTTPSVAAGQTFAGAAPLANPVSILVNGVSVAPVFAGLSAAGLYQFNLTIPSGLGDGDVSVAASINGIQSPSGVIFSLY
jgi:uncharacterized protein (TIGR03437 family)